MSLSPSSTGNLIFGLLISGISSCLTSLNFWTTILNLSSYYLTLKTMPLFLWALLITGGMLLLTLPTSFPCFIIGIQLDVLHIQNLTQDPFINLLKVLPLWLQKTNPLKKKRRATWIVPFSRCSCFLLEFLFNDAAVNLDAINLSHLGSIKTRKSWVSFVQSNTLQKPRNCQEIMSLAV